MMCDSGMRIAEPFRTNKANLYSSNGLPEDTAEERQAKSAAFALQVMRVKTSSLVSPTQHSGATACSSSSTYAADPSSSSLPWSQLQPATPTATDQRARHHHQQYKKRTRLPRHSTSSLGQQQTGNSTDQPGSRSDDLFKGRSASSRTIDTSAALSEEQEAVDLPQVVRPTGLSPRGLQPTTRRSGVASKPPFITSTTASEATRTAAASSVGGAAASPTATIAFPAAAMAAEPGSAGVVMLEAPLPARRPSLLRNANGNANTVNICTTSTATPSTASVAATVSVLPRIVPPGSVGAPASSTSPHTPPSPILQAHSQRSLLPAPPAAHKTLQSSLGIRRGQLPAPITSNGGGSFASSFGSVGGSPAISSNSADAADAGSATPSSSSLRLRLRNLRELGSPMSLTAVTVKSADPRRGSVEVSDCEELGLHQLSRSQIPIKDLFDPRQHQQKQNKQHQHLSPSSEDEEVRQHTYTDVEFQSASIPRVCQLPFTGTGVFLSDGAASRGGTTTESGQAAVAAAKPPSKSLRSRSFSRAAVSRSVTLDIPSGLNSASDDWSSRVGHGGRGSRGGRSFSRVATSTTSVPDSATSRSFCQTAPWVGHHGPAMGEGTASRRALSDWGADPSAVDSMDGGSGGSASATAGAVSRNPDKRAGSHPPHSDLPRWGYSSSHSMGIDRNSFHDGVDDVLDVHEDKSMHSVPGCLSRVRLFQSTEASHASLEADEDDINGSEDGMVGEDGGENTAKGDGAGQEGDLLGLELTQLDRILDPILDVLDPGRMVARRCMKRLQNGASGIHRPRAVESWAENESRLRTARDGSAAESNGSSSEAVSTTATTTATTDTTATTAATNTITNTITNSDVIAVDIATAAAPSLASLAGQVLKLPCVGLEKLSDPEKRQKVVQRLREGGDGSPAKFASSLATNRGSGGTRWQF